MPVEKNTLKEKIASKITEIEQLMEDCQEIKKPRQLIQARIKSAESFIKRNAGYVKTTEFKRKIAELKIQLDQKHPKKCHPGPPAAFRAGNYKFSRVAQEKADEIVIPNYYQW